MAQRKSPQWEDYKARKKEVDSRRLEWNKKYDQARTDLRAEKDISKKELLMKKLDRLITEIKKLSSDYARLMAHLEKFASR